VVFVVFDGVSILDFSGPASVFHSCSELVSRRASAGYAVTLASAGGGEVRTYEGIRMQVDHALDAAFPVDTLIVPGWGGPPPAHTAPRTLTALRSAAQRARRVASVCTGAFMLAEAGLLDGLRVATHWAACALLQKRHPRCNVEPQALFVNEGRIWTSAGVTAGIDLALQLVEDDFDGELAGKVARWLVVYARRGGGQSQRGALTHGERSQRDAVRRLSAWMLDHLREDLSLDRLAARVGMSRRNFTRTFSRELGRTVAEHLEAVRLEEACRLLEVTDRPLKRIAEDVGLGTPQRLVSLFKRRLSMTPGAYRASRAP
jgi:transcriptional regulator GlxA family with amidase domain